MGKKKVSQTLQCVHP